MNLLQHQYQTIKFNFTFWVRKNNEKENTLVRWSYADRFECLEGESVNLAQWKISIPV